MTKRVVIILGLVLLVGAVALEWALTRDLEPAQVASRWASRSLDPAVVPGALPGDLPRVAENPAPPAPVAADASAPASAASAPPRYESAPGAELLRGSSRPDEEPLPLIGLDTASIASALETKLPELNECYAAWLEQSPGLGGAMLISFTITRAQSGGGAVSQISIVDGGLGHQLLEGCVLNTMRDLQFDAPDAGLTVLYPLEFSSNGYADAGPG